MALYPAGHPSRERAIDLAYQHAEGLSSSERRRAFTFLEDEVVYGRDRLREFKGWDWAGEAGGGRHPAARVRAADHARRVRRVPAGDPRARSTPTPADTSERRQMRSLGIRFGSVGLQGQAERSPPPETTLDVTLGDEAETFRWLQDEIRDQGVVPLMEAEAVVRSLSVAMHADRRMVLPLLQLKEFDQYTTTHALNVVGAVDGAGAVARRAEAADSRDRRGGPAARHRQDPHSARGADQAGQAHRRGAPHHEPASGRCGAHHPGERRGAGAGGGGGLRAPHHAQRRRLPDRALRPRVHAGEPPGARVRRVRRAQHHAAVPRGVAAGQGAELSRRARRHRVRPRARDAPSTA